MRLENTQECMDKLIAAYEHNWPIVPVSPSAPHTITPWLDDYFLNITTSGSTGDPKPIRISKELKQKRIQQMIDLYGLTKDDVILVSTPLYHSLAIRLVLVAHTLGAKCVLMDSFTPEKFIDAIWKHGITFSIAVASQIRRVWAELLCESNELRCLVSSSERLDTSIKKEMWNANFDFHECYGTSEIAIATNWEAGIHEDESVGRAAPGVEIKIEDGEICVKSPYSTVDGWFKTGDLGRIDEDGYLYYLGRKDDVIITGGINVYPKDVEDVILQHLYIDDCAVIGIPDDTLGEVVTAVIQPRDCYRISPQQVRQVCAGKLADYQMPRKIRLMDEMPKNATGKVSRKELKRRLTDGNV